MWMSYSVNEAGNLRSGESLEKATYMCLEQERKTVLVNCSDYKSITKAIEKFYGLSQTGNFTYGGYANRFHQIREDFMLAHGRNLLDETVSIQEYGDEVKHWIDLGAQIVGGCCGIGVEYIQYLAETIFHEASDENE
jgi:S-methylmethionine-dependent homocysteine/selenocysteine methylase